MEYELFWKVVRELEMSRMPCIICKKEKKNIHLCEFKGMKIICDDCCKLQQSKKNCKIRGCGSFNIQLKK